MFSFKRKRGVVAGTAAMAAAVLVMSGCASSSDSGDSSPTSNSGGDSGTTAEPVTISVLADNAENMIAYTDALVAAFEAANPNITVETELRPGGADGDNLVKTRLATGEMNDFFFYNSGSLLQALNPDETLTDLSGEPWAGDVVESFWPTVSTANGKYGVPYGTAMGGGIVYNYQVYEDLGLDVPLTWDEFMANNKAIYDAGIAPVCQSYGDTWTSQLFVLADYHNVLAEEPDFTERYTNNQAKYATSAAAVRGFEYLEELHNAGYYNSDYASALFPDALVKVATGECAHYPQLTFVVSTLLTIDETLVNNIGFFAQPGASASTNGLTVWMPAAGYIPKSTSGAELEAAKAFAAFVASDEGIQVYIDTNGQTGPFLTKDAPSADDLYPAYADMFPYFEREGGTSPALEFVSPIKGPALEQITVATGTGQYSAAEAAALYDEDVKKQAQQLGIPGW
jgi:raffinose/stachyose/melibiose transport system substrate-binding protein